MPRGAAKKTEESYRVSYEVDYRPSSDACERQDRLKELQRRSEEEFFASLGLCECEQCFGARLSSSPKTPCWFKDEKFTASVVKAALLDGIKTSEPKRRELAIMLFNLITNHDHDGYISDLVHLHNIPTSELSALLRKRYTSKESVRLFEMAHILLVCSWKCDQQAVHQVFEVAQRLEHGNEEFELPFLCNDQEFSNHLQMMRKLFQKMVFDLVFLALMPDLKVMVFSSLFRNITEDYTVILTHTFLHGLNAFPWIECFLYNCRFLVKNMWIYQSHSDQFSVATLTLPGKAKMADRTEMPVSILPRTPKKQTCSLCKGKITKASVKMFPLEFFLSRDKKCYPREVFMTDGSNKYSIGVVCSVKCLLENEMMKCENLDDFLKSMKKKLAAKKNRQDTLEILSEMTQKIQTIPSVRLRFLALQMLDNELQSLSQLVLRGPEIFFLQDADTVPMFAGRDEPIFVMTKMSAYTELKKTSVTFFKDFFGIDEKDLRKKGGMKVELDPVENKDLIKLKYELVKRAESSKLPDETIIKEVRFLWRRQWGMVCDFANSDHTLTLVIKSCNTLQSAQDKKLSKTDVNASLQFCFHKGETVMFPVDNSFFKYHHFKKGIKFKVGVPPNAWNQRKLQTLTGENDYLLFAHDFDFQEGFCQGGFIYRCPDTESVVGVVIMNFYNYLMEGFGYQHLTNMYNCYALSNHNLSNCNPNKMYCGDTMDNHSLKEAIMFLMRLVLVRKSLDNMRREGKREIPKIPLESKKRLFLIQTTSHNNQPMTILFYLWGSKDSYQQYKDCLEASLDVEYLSFREKKVAELKGKMAEVVRAEKLAEKDVVYFVEDTSKWLNNFKYFTFEKQVTFINSLPLCKLALIIAESGKSNTYHYLVPNFEKLDRIITQLHPHLKTIPKLYVYFGDSTEDTSAAQEMMFKDNLTFEDFKNRDGQVIRSLRLLLTDCAKSFNLPLKESLSDKDSGQKKTKIEEKIKKTLMYSDGPLFPDNPPHLVWKGRLKVRHLSDKSFKLESDVWIKGMLRDKNILTVLRHHVKNWGRELTCTIVTDQNFVETVKYFYLKEAEKMELRVGPAWENENNMEPFMRSSLVLSNNSISIIPYQLEDKRWSFMTVMFVHEVSCFVLFVSLLNNDVPVGMLLGLPRYKDILHPSLEPSDFNICRDGKFICHNKFMSRLFNKHKMYVVVRSPAIKIAYKLVNSPNEEEDEGGEYVAFILEANLFENFVKDKDLTVADISYSSKTLPLHSIDSLVLMFFLGGPSDYEEMVSAGDWTSMAKHTVFLKIEKGQPTTSIDVISPPGDSNLWLQRIHASSRTRSAKSLENVKAILANEEDEQNQKQNKKADQDCEMYQLKLAKENRKVFENYLEVKSEEKEKKKKNVPEVKKGNGQSEWKSQIWKAPKLSTALGLEGKKDLEKVIGQIKRICETPDTNNEEEDLIIDLCNKCRLEGFDMNRCSLCNVTKYCSEKCLKADRSSHQVFCRQIHEDRVMNLLTIQEPLKFSLKK